MGVTALQAMEAEQRPAGCASFLYECHRVVSVDMDLIPSIERAWSTGLHSSSSLSSCDTQVDAPSSLTRMSSMASVGSDPATMAFRASSMPAYENHTSSEDTLARSLANCQVDVDCAAAAMEQLKTPSCDLEVDTTTDEFRMYKFKVSSKTAIFVSMFLATIVVRERLHMYCFRLNVPGDCFVLCLSKHRSEN